jgi:RNA polymerase sporulation-specific sigma factor
MTDEQKKCAENNIKLAYLVANRRMDCGLEFDEILSICFVALCKAAVGFDTTKGFTFSTYAVRAMHNQINYRLRPLARAPQIVSLEEPIVENLTLGDMIPSEINSFSSVEDAEILATFFAKLTLKQRRIFSLRYGLDGNHPHKEREIANILSTSQAYVSRVLKQGEQKLRRLWGADGKVNH